MGTPVCARALSRFPGRAFHSTRASPLQSRVQTSHDTYHTTSLHHHIMDRDFHHPYEPYAIQTQFMHAVYQCLEHGHVGIFESPTGTGKSLSLICGSLTWLRDHKNQELEHEFPTDVADEPAWMLDHARNQKKQAALSRRQDLQDRISKVKAKEQRMKERHHLGEPHPKRQKTVRDDSAEDVDEHSFVLVDYDSDDNSKPQKTQSFDDSGLSAETQRLMEQLGQSLKRVDDEDEVPDETKIFFCSRTHSQLTQFSNELRRVKMPPAISLDISLDIRPNSPDQHLLAEDVKLLTLGSRKNLCINPKVNRFGNATAINERCLELQQPGTSSDCKCSFMPSSENRALVNDFRDNALAKIRDIEDLGSLGRKLGICPYYASRPAAKYCEVRTQALYLRSTAKFEDYHAAVSFASSKVGARGTRSVSQRPHRHHRRST
jgi:chromosome transmission fidelity protein 1